MQNESNRNTIIFFVCALALLFGYDQFVMGPAEKRKALEAKQAAALQQKLHPGVPLAPGAAPQAVYIPLEKALAASPRVKIDTPALTGSIALKGGRIDDLDLKGYRDTIDPNSPWCSCCAPRAPITPTSCKPADRREPLRLPDENTVWTAPDGAVLTPSSPVTLTYAAPSGHRVHPHPGGGR